METAVSIHMAALPLGVRQAELQSELEAHMHTYG